MNTNEAIWIEWYSQEIDNRISEKLESTINLLSRNRLLMGVVTEIIKEEIANKVDVSKLSEDVIGRERVKWLEGLGIRKEDQILENITKRLNMLYINEAEMNRQCEIESKVHHWAIEQWGNDVSTMYLEKKDKFDIATFRMIRFEKEKYKLSNEIYHRIKNDELTFKEACMIHGTEQDRLNRGRPLKQSINQVNPSIRGKLNSMKPGQLSRPFKIPDWLIMIELLDLKTSILDETVKEVLIKERLVSFLKFAAIKVTSKLQTDTTNS